MQAHIQNTSPVHGGLGEITSLYPYAFGGQTFLDNVIVAILLATLLPSIVSSGRHVHPWPGL